MLEPSASGALLTRERDNRHYGNEVGHILLGGRRFSIVAAAENQELHAGQEVCCFEINGFRLAVFAGCEPVGRGCGAEDLAARLTGRELQIAVLVAQGHATKNIAYRLQISEWTVSTYLRRVFAKLNVDSRAAMVYRCASLIDATLTPLPQNAEAFGVSNRSNDACISVVRNHGEARVQAKTLRPGRGG